MNPCSRRETRLTDECSHWRAGLGFRLAAAILGLALPTPGSAEPAAAVEDVVPSLLVQTQSGAVHGILSSDGVTQLWLGLPYAEPPVGELRWKAPRPPASWSGVREADAYGAPCAQLGSIYGPPPPGKAWGPANVETYGQPAGSEDCLSLNLWRPNTTERSLPVLVFVHGGSNVAGYSADPLYEGAGLARAANALVVTINYRLGLFGWFTHPALEDGDSLDASGNYGTLDIIESLRYLRANAAAFGGDPDNVTLMGQSAGAINVYSLMGSELAAGLFHKAILLSGLIGDSTKKAKGQAYAENLAVQLIVRDGLAATPEAAAGYAAALGPAWFAQYLRSKTSDQILELLGRERSLRKMPGGFGDGTVLPDDLAAAFDEGRFHRVPVIVGTTRDEAKLFMSGLFRLSDAERFRRMLDSNPDAPPKFKTKDILSGFLLPGLGSGLYDAYAATVTRLLMRGVNASIARLARHAPQVFVYRFDWNQGPEPWRTVYGASHAIDLPFVFGNFSNNFFAMDFSKANRPGREALSRLMMQAIGTFLRTGNPNAPGLTVEWSPRSAAGDARSRLILDATAQGAALSAQRGGTP